MRGCELDEGMIVAREFVLSGRDAPTLLDLVEEPFDQVACAIQIRTQVNRSLQFRFGGMFIHASCCRASSLIVHAVFAIRIVCGT